MKKALVFVGLLLVLGGAVTAALLLRPAPQVDMETEVRAAGYDWRERVKGRDLMLTIDSSYAYGIELDRIEANAPELSDRVAAVRKEIPETPDPHVEKLREVASQRGIVMPAAGGFVESVATGLVESIASSTYSHLGLDADTAESRLDNIEAMVRGERSSPVAMMAHALDEVFETDTLREFRELPRQRFEVRGGSRDEPFVFSMEVPASWAVAERNARAARAVSRGGFGNVRAGFVVGPVRAGDEGLSYFALSNSLLAAFSTYTERAKGSARVAGLPCEWIEFSHTGTRNAPTWNPRALTIARSYEARIDGWKIGVLFGAEYVPSDDSGPADAEALERQFDGMLGLFKKMLGSARIERGAAAMP